MDACHCLSAHLNRVKPFFLASVLLLCVLLSAAVHAQSIRIGLSGPFTGGSSPMGESMRNGVRLATEEINNSGGINGLPIELIERDDSANNETGAKIADELTRTKVAATIGIVNTGVGLT